jgi:hypothetical protein
VDAAAVEAAVLAEIKTSRNGAEHFRVLSLLGSGEFGYVFKVRANVYKCMCVHAAARCVRGWVVCVHVCAIVARCAARTRDTRTRASSTR